MNANKMMILCFVFNRISILQLNGTTIIINNNNNNLIIISVLSDPCSCWCAWYSKEGDGRKHQESIRENYCDRDSKDLHAGICANPQK